MVDDLLLLMMRHRYLGEHLLTVLVDGLRVKFRIGLLGKFFFLCESRDVVLEGDIHTERLTCVFHVTSLLEREVCKTSFIHQRSVSSWLVSCMSHLIPTNLRQKLLILNEPPSWRCPSGWLFSISYRLWKKCWCVSKLHLTKPLGIIKHRSSRCQKIARSVVRFLKVRFQFGFLCYQTWGLLSLFEDFQDFLVPNVPSSVRFMVFRAIN